MSAEAQTAPAAPQAAAAPAPGTPWSLDDCIGYALANNIDVQQRALQVEQNEVELSTAKYSRLPDLNASIGGDASFGRVLSSDNTYKDNNQTSGSLNISTSLPVFQGMRINRQVNAEDTELITRVQQGMQSKSFTMGPLSDKEVCLKHFCSRMRDLIPEARLEQAPKAGWSRA